MIISDYIYTTACPPLSYRFLILWNLKFSLISKKVVCDACRKQLAVLQGKTAGSSKTPIPIHRLHSVTYLKTVILTFAGWLGHVDQKLPNNDVKKAFA